MPDLTTGSTFSIGALTLTGIEVPSSLPWGGTQKVKEQRLKGGVLVADVMGPEDRPLVFEGEFLGSDAKARARTLDGYRKAGVPITLVWDDFRYSVLVIDFEPNYLLPVRLPYKITCLVIADQSTPAAPDPGPGLDSMLSDDATTAQSSLGLAGGVFDSDIGALSSAVQAVPSFQQASGSDIAGVTGPIASIQAQVTSLSQTNTAVLASVTDFGGVTAGGDPATLATQLGAQADAMALQPQLLSLGATATRMALNLSAVGVSGTTVQSSDSLYAQATAAYGTPVAWTTIARANGLTDPVLSDITTLLVPPTPDTTGGVLAP